MTRTGCVVLLWVVSCILSARGDAVDDLRSKVEHVVIFMQENRPFDHYLGTLAGVRGFNDRATVPMRSGFNAFYQPIDQSDLSLYMLPFPAESDKTAAMCSPAPEMYYPTDLAMWNVGRVDSWNTARDPGLGMSFYSRRDLPYYYALWDGFTVLDQYFQSTFTSTNPNRMHLFSGSNGVSVGEPAVVENDEPVPGFNWTTVGEILEDAQISWRVYQQLDNFDDNGFAWFNAFQQAKPGDPLWDKGMSRQRNLIEAFGRDIENGQLPQVSFIIAPTAKSEHASNHPCDGEDFSAKLLQKLRDNPSVYATTALFLMYDEGGQFFDHSLVPVPPVTDEMGVSTVTVEGEINADVLVDGPSPVGPGFRVPFTIVSPWTRGAAVYSEVTDHTSVIRFLEARFNISCPNISPWRRAMMGDLVGAFDFANPDVSWPDLPDTSHYVEIGNLQCDHLPPLEVPTEQAMPRQEPGTRVTRALPYEFVVRDRVDPVNGQHSVVVANKGTGGGVFVLFDILDFDRTPRHYSVEGGATIVDPLPLSAGRYDRVLVGHNGFVRRFSGTTECSWAQAVALYEPEEATLVLVLANEDGPGDMVFSVVDNAYNLTEGIPSEPVVLVPGSNRTLRINLASSDRWYDMTVRGNGCYERRFMGHVENGLDSRTDPAMANNIPGLWNTSPTHPPLPAYLTTVQRIVKDSHKDAQFFPPSGPVDL
eukprot:CAMPEP_0119119962 /NCGR_PEP_ID=MMETSP1310-20130426/1222_1 /TAXON_ID=464262 /ORGANISM="Genus nov. species nov., Strain RCC2339" /LENGTH=702 /DNA_ID=CAMNT_0007109421 /DNA_START=130 /DNA_END=2238 /DNA_ORIENTATION=-